MQLFIYCILSFFRKEAVEGSEALSPFASCYSNIKVKHKGKPGPEIHLVKLLSERIHTHSLMSNEKLRAAMDHCSRNPPPHKLHETRQLVDSLVDLFIR